MNQDIKILMLQKNVRQWVVARELNVTEATLSRWLREPLSEQRRALIVASIEKIRKSNVNQEVENNYASQKEELLQRLVDARRENQNVTALLAKTLAIVRLQRKGMADDIDFDTYEDRCCRIAELDKVRIDNFENGKTWVG